MQNQTRCKTTNGATAIQVDSIDENVVVSKLIELYTQTGMRTGDLFTKMSSLIESCRSEEKWENFVGLALALVIYQRDIGDGKGRRDESRAMLSAVFSKFAEQKEMLKLLLRTYFERGYWGDAKKILELFTNGDFNSEEYQEDVMENLKNSTVEIVAEQLQKDWESAKSGDQFSNCAKWLPMPRGKTGKGKNHIAMCLQIARTLFPEIKPNTFYYKYVDGKLDTGSKLIVTDATPDYYRWVNLLMVYKKFLQKLRRNIPYVEQYMQKNSFARINPSMLTSSNKLRLDKTLRNQPPRYLLDSSSRVPKRVKDKMRARCQDEIRFNTDDRKRCAENYGNYEEEVAEKQKEKAEKIKQLKERLRQASDKAELGAELSELAELLADKTTNFNAGTPLDVYRAYDGQSAVNQMFENCIQELMLGKYADFPPCLCIADTSGSMYSGYNSGNVKPIDVCIAMTAFCSMAAPSTWKNRFIQFASKSYLVNMPDGSTFYDYIQYMRNHQVNVGSTNFESVLNLLKIMFTGVNPAELPKYLVFFSDMQFNQAVNGNWSKMTASRQMENLFTELGFSNDCVPTVVFWNLNSYENRPATASDSGVVMLSGFNPKQLIDLDTIIENAIPEKDLTEHCRINKKIDTWNSLVSTLTNSEATVDFLEKLKEHIDHQLLD